MDISISGAGPAGNWLGYLLAKEGINSNIFEEHKQVGEPVQCTGIVTNSIKKLVPLDESFIVNRIKKAEIFVSSDKVLDLKFKKENFIFDRAKFDKYLASLAKNEGVKFNFSHKLVGLRESDKLNLIFKNKKVKDADILVGADGPYSVVGRLSGLVKKNNHVLGLQTRVKGKFDSEAIEFYLKEGDFAWVVPESNRTARIGVVSKSKPLFYLKKFLKKRMNLSKIDNYQGGAIPCYNPRLKIQKDNRIFLLGDAACQVKGVSHGGIIQGLMAAEELSQSIISSEFDYSKRVKQRMGKDLWYNMIARRFFNSLSEKDCKNLFLMLENKPSVKNLLEAEDRDFPSKFVLSLFIKEPRLWLYLFKFLSKGGNYC